MLDENTARKDPIQAAPARVLDENTARKDPIEPVWLEAALLLHTHAFASPEIIRHAVPGLDDLQRAVLARAMDYTFIRYWYLFMSSYDQGHGGPAMRAYTVFDGAPPQVTEHPEAQVAMGAVDEIAWVLAEEDRPSVSRLFTPSLARAEGAYRRALASAPALHEARLRLARVLTLRKRYDEALATLAELPPDVEAGYRYLAQLFEGDALERRDDPDGAARAYARAIAVMPHAQSATMALDRTRGMVVEDDIGTDPWLWYRLGTAWRTNGYLAAMQAIVARPPAETVSPSEMFEH